jgi:hypothetical protein
MAASEDFDGGLQRTMHQKFRAPIKEVRFAGIKFRSALVFANGSERLVLLFGNLGQQVMEITGVLSSQGGLRCGAGLR